MYVCICLYTYMYMYICTCMYRQDRGQASSGSAVVVRVPCLVSTHTPPWRQPRSKWMVHSVNSHTNATRVGWHLWEIGLRFAHGLPPGWSLAFQFAWLHIRKKMFHANDDMKIAPVHKVLLHFNSLDSTHETKNDKICTKALYISNQTSLVLFGCQQ